MCDENELDEREQKALLAALQRRAEIDEKRGHATFWHADNSTQPWMEVDAVRNWSTEMNRRGFQIDIGSIRKNSDAYPDCLAKMSGRTFGVEVTELVDSEAIREYGRFRRAAGSEWDPLGSPGPSVLIWDLGTFRSRLDEITLNKDARVRDSALVKQFLLILTDESWLCEETVLEYLDAVKLKRPKHFDQVYLMLSPVPNGSGNRRYPVFEVPLEA